MSEAADRLRFDEHGLIPAVVQDAASGRVLMFAFMNRESLEKTLATREAHFWSRSRGALWRKGETSGNVLRVVEIRADCDADCLLLRVDPAGPACHTGETSCFFTSLVPGDGARFFEIVSDLAAIVRSRKDELPAGSYTSSLFEAGVDRIAKKVGEEAVEVVIAAKNRNRDELARESADLLYHLLVLWEEAGLSLAELARELVRRRR